MTAALEKRIDSFTRKLIDHIERASAVGSTGVVAEINVVVFRKGLANLFEDCQAAIA